MIDRLVNANKKQKQSIVNLQAPKEESKAPASDSSASESMSKPSMKEALKKAQKKQNPTGEKDKQVKS